MYEFNWEEFDKLHVVRRLKQLVGKWWNVQVNFTDEKGFLRGVPEGRFFNPINPVCVGITREQKGFRGCMGTVKKTTVDAHSAKKTQIARCHAGFSTVSVPIRIDGKYLGCVFGDGFIVAETAAEQKITIKNYLNANFNSDKELVSYIDKLPVLSEKEVVYLRELIEMVVEEILSVSLHLSQTSEQVDQLKTELNNRFSFDQMIGKSNTMQLLYQLIERVCDSSALVLIQGENGTGKELIARALHYNSKRRKQKFLVINCGAFNENLLESELFGHVKGSFTGAIKDKEGLFEAANGGTIFLDEIGDTSPTMQVKLLRVLQESTYTPVGSTEMRKSTARVVCATNKDLVAMVKNSTFREDLFYRLNVINVTVPALRERREDIPLLAKHFLVKFSKEANQALKELSQACLQHMLDYDWPGNVRELENEIERLCVLSGDTKLIEDTLLSLRIQADAKVTSLTTHSQHRLDGKLKDALEELEKHMILDGLRRNHWNKSKLAKELGISRAGLILKVEKYGLEKRAS